MENKDKEEQLKFIWKKRAKLGNAESLKPIINALILLLEEEKKRTLDKIEKTKKTVDIIKMKNR